MTIKTKNCKHCKELFTPLRPLQAACSFSCAIELTNKANKKKWDKEKKVRKEGLKTLSDHLKECQVIFNRFIRLRDSGLNCISCDNKCKKENAGHYRSVGGNPEYRFNELNCHLQCEYCNTYLHGNLINYRINLIKKIGLDEVEKLECYRQPIKYSIDEVKELKEYYKQQIKNLKQ